MDWHLLEFNGNNQDEINLNLTLNCGQAFRWQFHDGEWRCGFNDFIARLKQHSNSKVYFFSDSENYAKIKNFLVDYFRCDFNTSEKFNALSKSDPHFALVYNKYPGIRLLRQHPVENLFSFICSSNNNIGRITKLVGALATNFSLKQQFLIDAAGKSICYPAFPSVDELLSRGDKLEESLRSLRFGYRAKYIRITAERLRELGGENRLLALRNDNYDNAKKFLLTLSGVGAKVADCVLLGSLDQMAAVPIDVHMFRVMRQYYGSHFGRDTLSAKSITNSVYEDVRAVCNELWQPYPGWVQLVGGIYFSFSMAD